MKRVLVPPAFAHYPEAWHLSPALDTGRLVFLSGVTGVHPDGALSDDPETQFRDTFMFLGETLGAADLGFEHIVEMTTYHVGLKAHLATFTKVKDEFVASPYPAWSAIGITELITEGTLLEVRVIAMRP